MNDTDPDRQRSTEPLLRIGPFSRATMLSVKALRRYHELGLLVPSAVDPDTGYRAYHAGHLVDGVTIRRLRDLDVPIPVIRRILDARDPAVTRQALADHAESVRARVAEATRILDELENDDHRLGSHAPVHVESIDHGYGLGISGTVSASSFGAFLDVAFGRLFDAVTRGLVAPIGAGAALYAPSVHDRSHEPVTAYLPIEEPIEVPTALPGVEVVELPAITAAVLVHDGPCEDVGDTYARLGAWVAHHAETLADDDPRAHVREIYLHSPADTSDPTTYRTAIQWPIRSLRSRS